MYSFADLIAAIQSDLTLDDNSTLYPLPTLQLAINRSYHKCAALFKWPHLEDAQTTSTMENEEYYDYPPKWKPNSIWRLTVGGVDYGDPIGFKDYLFERQNNYPSRLQHMWGNQFLRYFMYPIPISNGDSDIVIWGRTTEDDLSSDGDLTIFSQNMPECNEAIVLEAGAILRNKGEILQPVMRSFISGSQLLSAEAQNILTTAWGKIREEQTKYERTQPFFEVSDMFSNRSSVRNKIGDFD